MRPDAACAHLERARRAANRCAFLCRDMWKSPSPGTATTPAPRLGQTESPRIIHARVGVIPIPTNHVKSVMIFGAGGIVSPRGPPRRRRGRGRCKARARRDKERRHQERCSDSQGSSPIAYWRRFRPTARAARHRSGREPAIPAHAGARMRAASIFFFSLFSSSSPHLPPAALGLADVGCREGAVAILELASLFLVQGDLVRDVFQTPTASPPFARCRW